jgi:hypothetical protein
VGVRTNIKRKKSESSGEAQSNQQKGGQPAQA